MKKHFDFTEKSVCELGIWQSRKIRRKGIKSKYRQYKIFNEIELSWSPRLYHEEIDSTIKALKWYKKDCEVFFYKNYKDKTLVKIEMSEIKNVL